MFTCGKCQKEISGDGAFCPFCGTARPLAPTEVAEPQIDPVVGQTVVGKYRVLNLIDRGGMGQVYRATHLALDRPVALKMLNRALLADPALVQRFHREARAASRLNHPNSVAIIDFGETEDGTLFMAMELVPGRSLARLIAEEFPLGTPRVGKIGSQILAALTEAHGLGILHCDLKPQNVMIESRHDETDVVKVVDFGIAKLLEGADGPRLTRAGTVAGTPGYMSPEQARGETLDPRSDLYSVGVILYELVTGKLPFAAPSPMGMVGKMLSERPTPPSVRRPDMSIPPDLEALIMRALSPDRQDRPASADEFRRLLAACAPATDRGKTPAAGAPGGAASPTPARAGAPATLATPGKTPSGRAREVPASPSSGATRIGPPPPAAPARRRDAGLLGALPIIGGSAVGAVLLGGILVWALSGGGEPSPIQLGRAAAPAEPARAPGEPAARPAGPAAPPAPAPPEPAATRPAEAPPSRPPAPAARPPETPRSGPRPPPAKAPRRPADPALRTTLAFSATGSPDALAIPDLDSGEGILTVVAPPGTALSVDGRAAGEAPREWRLAQGSYRVRARRAGASVEATMQVAAGERSRWEVEFGQ